MKVNISVVSFVLDEKKSSNKKRNDEPKIKIILNKNKRLINIPYKKGDFKDVARDYMKDIIGYKEVSLEQVYTFSFDEEIYITYLAIMNIESIKSLNNKYELYDFEIKNNVMSIGNEEYKYKTNQYVIGKSINYMHEFKNNLDNLNDLLMIITSYKYIKSRLDITDIMYKFLPNKFTLESVRLLYEYISGKSVDKSNFRKKIVNNCKELDEVESDKGYRPSKLYTVEPNMNDIWI